MTLLTMINSVQDQLGLPRSSSVVGSTDQTTRTLLALANVEGQDLQQRANWQRLNLQVTHTTVATESQGALDTIMPGFKFLLNDIIWNRTIDIPIFGPQSPQAWQQALAMTATGPYNYYRIRGNELLIYPVCTAGQTLAMEYASKNWCESSGGTKQSAWAADTDVGLLDERIMALGVRWRFQESKGFAYAGSQSTYERQVQQAIAREGSRGTVNMGDSWDYWPTALAPNGSWNIP